MHLCHHSTNSRQSTSVLSIVYTKNHFISAVTGFGTEAQILESLNRPCYLQRPKYIQKTLYYLFKMTQGTYEPRIEMSLPRIDIIYVRFTFFSSYHHTSCYSGTNICSTTKVVESSINHLLVFIGC